MAAVDHPRFFNAVISTSSSGVNIETGLLSTRSASQPPSLERSPTPRVDPQRWGISTSRSGEILVSVVSDGVDGLLEAVLELAFAFGQRCAHGRHEMQVVTTGGVAMIGVAPGVLLWPVASIHPLSLVSSTSVTPRFL